MWSRADTRICRCGQGRFNIVADAPEDAQKRLARGNSVASLIDKSAAPSAMALLPCLKVPRTHHAHSVQSFTGARLLLDLSVQSQGDV